MTIEIKVPPLPESVSDATVAKCYKKAGDTVARNENLFDLETDKVMLEVVATQAGVLETVAVQEGAVVTSGQLLATIKEGASGSAAAPAAEKTAEKPAEKSPASGDKKSADNLSPSVRRMVSETGANPAEISGSGKGGRVTKEDVAQHLSQGGAQKSASSNNRDERVPMSRLRARVAERLLQSQQQAAILTTFNEINMKPVMDLRSHYKDAFEKKYGVRLGFMSFFATAAVEALKRFPAVNASIDGNDIIYHHYYDIGVAIGSERGLVVPVLRNVQDMSMADIETAIRDYAAKAKENKLTIEDLTGGTFTITNGGTFGSMLSTPIINPPQTAILGMHNIVERPVVENGQIVIRPIMYVALSYDHRLIDGREAVLFLVTIKQLLEDPARWLLDV